MSAFEVLLGFDNNNRRQSFSVKINDDELLESIEDFNLELRFDPFFTQPSGVVLSPDVSTVYIVDDLGDYFIDSVQHPVTDMIKFTTDATIGFIYPPYSVNENGGQMLIPVGVLGGTLEREVVVSFFTSDSTAIGK